MCCIAVITQKFPFVPRNGLDESGDARINFTRVVEILEKAIKKPDMHTASLAFVGECSSTR